MEEQPAFESGAERPNGALDIETTNMLQMELMELSGQDPESWIRQHSAAFRDVINEDQSYFARLYQTDHEACLHALKEKLDARVLH
jgi:hypothetical protein